jgi:mRNA-degrading endonuclease toxin of MazEF toxin-antitoxin module
VAIRQGAIFAHNFGPRQNNLQEGPRPVVVVQADALNKLEGYGNVIVVPLTTKQKPAKTFIQVEPSSSNDLDRASWAITNQIFTISKWDLVRELGSVSKTELYQIKEGLKIALGIG